MKPRGTDAIEARAKLAASESGSFKFTNGKRPGVRSADRILADAARARGNFGPSRSVGGGLVDLDEVRATWTTKVKAAARARLLAVPGQRRR